MKTTLGTLLLAGISACGLAAFGQNEQAQSAEAAAPAAVDLAAGTKSDAAEETISFTADVPLEDAIMTLGRLARLNIIVSPTALTGPKGPDGKALQPPPRLGQAINWPGVPADQALEALLKNHNLALDRDPKSPILRVIAKDPNTPDPLIPDTKLLAYANPTNVATLIKATISARSQVLADSRTSQLIILATAKEHEDIAKLIEKLDTPTKQVLIEARLIETARNPSSVKGVDWSPTLTAQRVTFGNGLSTSESTTTSPGNATTTTLPSGRTLNSQESSSTETITRTIMNGLPPGLTASTASGFTPQTAFLNADGASVVLSFLNSDSDSEVIATPRAVTLDNEEAKLEVTRSFPIFTQNPGSSQTPSTTTLLYTNVGAILRVTPRISSKSKVAMKVTPEVSNIDGKDRQVIGGSVNEANIYAVRRITTSVVIPSGHTLVMGGLVSDATKKGSNKVPLFGDIPGLGWAFRHESKSRSKANLLIFITPTIVEDGDFKENKDEEKPFLKTPVPKDRPETKETSWDSAKPHDWSKPVY